MERASVSLKSETIKKQIFGRIAELLYEEGLLTTEEKNSIKNVIEQEVGQMK